MASVGSAVDTACANDLVIVYQRNSAGHAAIRRCEVEPLKPSFAPCHGSLPRNGALEASEKPRLFSVAAGGTRASYTGLQNQPFR
jgi:hypothetical protein